MSKSAFFHAFKKQFAVSPLEYILRERIQQAKRIMTDDTISIAEACYRSGFNNPNYFIKLFKRMEGLTPKEYKNDLSDQI
jgi:AraC-like DNA-binding protein